MVERKANKRGLFLAVDGPEGCGKTTQARRLADWLRARNHPVIGIREPGGTLLGEEVRKLLLDSMPRKVEPLSELFLFLAARAELVREVIQPSLEAGRFVVSDRFSASTLAYQVFGMGLDRKFVEEANSRATGGVEPDMTFLLDLDPEEGFTRLQEQGTARDRIEKRGLEFHRKVRAGYLQLAKDHPKRFVVVDASPAELAVWESLEAMVERLLEANGFPAPEGNGQPNG